MAKRKLKIKFVRFLLLIVLLILGLFFYFEIIGDDIKVIYINNNHFYTDQEIIDLAKISDYPSFFKTTKREIKKRLTSDKMIKDVNITKKSGRIVIINVVENNVLFKNSNNGKYVLNNGKEYQMDKTYDVPVLLNYVPGDIYKQLIKNMSLINNEVLSKMSEIKYAPNDYDDDLIIIYMKDKNLVQVTINKLQNIAKYNEIVSKLDGKNGILYLDSGNYFKIME